MGEYNKIRALDLALQPRMQLQGRFESIRQPDACSVVSASRMKIPHTRAGVAHASRYFGLIFRCSALGIPRTPHSGHDDKGPESNGPMGPMPDTSVGSFTFSWDMCV